VSEHTCHATDCDAHVPPKMFMCRRHWFMVPKPMRDLIWALYRPGQEVDKDPSMDYLDATAEAINFVYDRERADLTDVPWGRTDE
jgi:hypothetical protein